MNGRKLFVVGGCVLLVAFGALFIAARITWLVSPDAREAVRNFFSPPGAGLGQQYLLMAGFFGALVSVAIFGHFVAKVARQKPEVKPPVPNPDDPSESN